MAQFKTRLRLNQVTGSLGDFEGGIIDTRGAGSATLADVAILSGSMVGILSELASSVKRITGAGSFASGVAGQFDQSIKIPDDGQIGSLSDPDALAISAAGQLRLSAVTDASSVSSGALRVDGGVGIAKKLYVGLDLDVDGVSNLDVVDIDGAVDMALTLAVAGTSTLAGINASGILDVTNATDASDASGDTGALRTEGGASIAKKLYVGTDLDVDGVSNLDVVDIDGAVDMASTLQVDGVLTTTAAAVSTGGMLIGTDSHLEFRDAAVYAASLTDGSLDLVADAEIHLVAPALNFDGAADISGNLTIGGDFIVNGTTTTVNSSTVQIDDLNLQLADGAAAASAVNGGGLTLATSGDDFTWNYNHASTAWKSSIDVDAASGKAYKVNGASVLNATTLGGSVVNSSLTSLGTQAEALVMGSNAISGAGAIGAASLTATGAVTAGSFVIGSADISEAELEMIDGITAGTAAASKAMVLDASLDISGGRNLTISGELDAATGDFSGNIDVDGVANLDDVDIDGSTQIDGTVTVGEDDTGYTVKFFGAPASAFMLWDQAANKLELGGVAGLIVPESKLIIGGTPMTSTAAELNLLDGVAGLVKADFTKLAAVDSTAAELNIVDGNTSASAVTLVAADRVVVNDDGVMKQVSMVDMLAYMQLSMVQKAIFVIPSGVAANSDFDLDPGSSGFGARYTDANDRAREVYVNGQLMSEGADAAGNMDFYPGSTAGTIKFEFALEADDVIQVVLRKGV